MKSSHKPLIINGKQIASEILEELKHEISDLRAKKVTPGLAVVLVGDNPASEVYVRNKRKTCEELGIDSFAYDLPDTCSEKKLLKLIDKLNADPKIHGILVQLPLPRHINEKRILEAILPEKDVDGFHPVNVGRLLNGEDCFVSCTPAGCHALLLRSGIKPAGKHVVIVGRSNIVGKPLAALLMQKAANANATVTICHSNTRNMSKYTQEADILVAAMGVPEFIKPRMVREGAVVIDVGVNRISDPTRKSGNRLVGDVAFSGVSKKAKAITPVPGGVGPMTIAMLMKNTVKAVHMTLAKR
ncbi:MAG: bifunctional methylenetetrahydrofolate dehydrogenase/methenyltetrahydrofolate cyclohydrolase FolD [Candidatus Hydrogenedentes bacterium]|jgi:methylenetetrahydrofolate dehydrogenase (NADP+)/methenyltetrahydrofolate cyclohydrolase|nr:bifunctional methylenetetrahydrofolate dehydrogenase/methenyltetrahydrofolate cyclohydrolase FolD [Candidatus Hydrogenedentota bacterium]